MSKRPNILWICSDQQRYDTVHALGNNRINTPTLDRLAAEGVAFTRAYCQNPLCQPSRASFLTGRYPRTVGVRQNGQEPYPDHETLITKRLADAGYTCGLVGKLHLSACCGRVEERTDDGYSHYYWSHHPWPNKEWKGHHDYQDWIEARGVTYSSPKESHDRVMRGVHPGVVPEHHQSTWCADRAIKFMDEVGGDRPWCLSINPFDPHHPFDPPFEYLNRYNPDDMPDPAYREGELELAPFPHQVDRRGAYGGSNKDLCYDELTPHQRRNIVAAYYAMIELLDAQVGRILDHLEKTGQRENTIVIYTSDHGELLGDHGLYLKGPYFYDCSVRVPLLISYPRAAKPGLQSNALVELTDLVPTLCDLVEMPTPENVHGRSLAGILTGDSDPGHHRDDVYCEYYNSSWTYDGRKAYATMLFDGRHKVVCYHGCDDGELFDLEADPDECHSLWNSPDHRELKQDMVKRCFDRCVFTMDPSPPHVTGW